MSNFFLHLANGEVKNIAEDELTRLFEESGTRNAVNVDGKHMAVIGVYPDDIELPKDESEVAEVEEKK